MTKITSIGFVTCDRLEALERGLISYIENGRRYERAADFVVMDDSTSVATRSAYRQMLRSLKDQYGVSIRYAGAEEKAGFIDRMVRAADLPRETLDFALFGPAAARGSTIGANRNALLLDTIGEVILSADDDTVCLIAPAPDLEERPSFTSGQPRPEIWFFPDREAAFQSVNFVERDVLAIHEQYLGEHLCIGRHAPGVQKGRIRVTVNGIVGDCGWDWPSYMFLTGDSFKRLTRSDSSHRSASISRERLQVVNRTTLTNQVSGLMTTVVGFDNRGPLPPFIPAIPMGRNEEIAFEAILCTCLANTWITYLPWALLHAPIEARSFSSDDRSVFFMGLPFLIQLCAFSLHHGAADEEGNLRCLGTYLEELGGKPGPDFESFVWRKFKPIADSLILEAENRLHSSGELPEFWRSDLKRSICRMRQEVSSLLDFLYGFRPEGREQIQSLIRQFGELLRVWPEIVEAAQRLKIEGYPLAQPI